MGRGFRGKAMVVSVDKATAVRMYDKVQKHWKLHLADLQAELETCDEIDRPELEAKVDFMQETDMAVVISQGQNEIADMREKGLDIVPHRKRMVEEDLDTKFKDPDDPFRLVFVCAMWMTGFDVPVLLHHLPRQAHAQPHPDADHRPCQPRLGRKGQRPDRGLHRRLPRPAAGAGHLRLRFRWRGWRGRSAGRRPSRPWWRSCRTPSRRRRTS